MTPARAGARILRLVPNIMVISHQPESGEAAVVWSERVGAELLESPHFGAQLLERVKWALEDAEKGEREGAAGRPGVATLATSQGD